MEPHDLVLLAYSAWNERRTDELCELISVDATSPEGGLALIEWIAARESSCVGTKLAVAEIFESGDLIGVTGKVTESGDVEDLSFAHLMKIKDGLIVSLST